jgi:hypothetical protein
VLIGSSDSHGHVVELEATGIDPTAFTVEWEPDGVWITDESDHRVFVYVKTLMTAPSPLNHRQPITRGVLERQR